MKIPNKIMIGGTKYKLKEIPRKNEKRNQELTHKTK